MWEAIEANKRRSRILLTIMGILLLLLGYFVGAALFVDYDAASQLVNIEDTLNSGGERGPETDSGLFGWLEDPSQLINGGGVIGAGVAMVIWVIMTIFAFLGADSTLLRIAGAHEIDKQAAPQLWNVVEEMTLASGLPNMPRVYLIPTEMPNAFATGLKPEKGSVAVTSGLLKRLNRDELQGVVAHEIAHIHNLDIRFMTLASVMVGSTVMISEMFLRSLWFGAGRRSSSSKGNQGQAILMVIAIIFAIIAPIAARMLYFACSRKREYLADACAARFTRYPPGLASALRKITGCSATSREVHKSLAPLYIVNPLEAAATSAGLFSTHPPMESRVAVLESMSGAGYTDYETAYSSVVGGSTGMSAEFLNSEASVKTREATVEAKKKEAVERAQEALDVITRAANFVVMPCACGVRMKIPPDLDRDEFDCPRCGRGLVVPHAELQTSDAEPEEDSAEEHHPGPVYKRTGEGWESFRCVCNGTIQLSPTFSADMASCKKCGRHVKIVS